MLPIRSLLTVIHQRGTVKVDAARRQGGIHIVWLAWFLDSLALWRRQDEQAYFIDADPVTSTGIARPTVQVPEEVAENEDDGELITPDADIWADANAEVDAVLEETDDEDEGASFLAEDDDGDSGWRTDGSGMRLVLSFVCFGYGVLNVGTLSTGSAKPGTPRRKKRARSSSASDMEGSMSREMGGVADEARSPLAKRKRLSAARRGSSRLKVGLVADEISGKSQMAGREESDEDDDVEVEDGVDGGERGREEQDSIASTDGSASGGDDDDFLARELEEEEVG